jgi:nicotinate-nucleotide pyrophosphorylase (carboxylating)
MTLNAPTSESYAGLIRAALAEDIGSGDVTTVATVPEGLRARGTLLAKSALVVAGLDVAMEAFRQLDPTLNVEVRWGDGAHLQPHDVIAVVTGDARALLTAERTALNVLQRLSGIATLTNHFVTAAGNRITVLDTRKTTPGWRTIEKYAVRCGGGTNHRQRLDDGVLIKDNHKRLAGGVTAAIAAAQKGRHGLPIEVEVETLDELGEALAAGAPRILLDNFTTYDIRVAMERIAGRATVEISGGVTLERLRELGTTGAQFVSVGALTHSAPAADISFELEGD